MHSIWMQIRLSVSVSWKTEPKGKGKLQSKSLIGSLQIKKMQP